MANQRLEDSERKAIEGSADALERWEQADSEERRRELDRVGRQMLDVWGAPNPPLAPERWEDDRCLGQYCDEDYRIEVNQRLLERDDPREALEAYLHEYRHASQVYDIERSHGVLAHEVDPQRTAELERSRQEYVLPEEDERGYQDQLLERDAREFASREAEQILAERNAREEKR